MRSNVFDSIRAIVYQNSGILLSDRKEALMSSRLAKRMRKLQIQEYDEYLTFLQGDDSGEEMVHLLDAISTNVTHFFREPQHFDFIGQRVREWQEKGQRRFRFWSAGCSSGEEPLSLGMTILEAIAGHSMDIRILATDLSTQILARSRTATYSEEKVQDIPPALRNKYFAEIRGTSKDEYRAGEQLRSIIAYHRLNLVQIPYPMNGPLDAIFCRNVMIYFDNDVRRKLLSEFSRLIRIGGYLLVGHAESLTGMLSGFRPVIPSVYLKVT